MKPCAALFGAAAGTHAADQLALATLPLTATLVLGAGPDILGLLVAAQSAAWLLVTLPAGAWADRMPRRSLLIVGLALGLMASLVAVVAAALGITVNAIAPGYTETDMVAAVPANVLEKIVAKIPVGRLGKADEIARGVMFLVADDAGFITGSTLSINGGQHMY